MRVAQSNCEQRRAQLTQLSLIDFKMIGLGDLHFKDP
jgi:hypothetical protein